MPTSNNSRPAAVASALVILAMASFLRRSPSHRWLPGFPWYDMFAAAVPSDPADRYRTVVVMHLMDGSDVVTPAHRLLPFEAVRNSSIVLEYLAGDRQEIAELCDLSRNALERGWRAFDQVWPPAVSTDARIAGMCVHRVRSNEVEEIGSANHYLCPQYQDLR